MTDCGAQLNAAAFGQNAMQCESQTGYAFFGILLLPTADKITKICANADCLAVMAAIRAELPKECKTSHSNHQLYAQILNPIQNGCTKTPTATTAAPTPPAATPAPPPATTTTKPTTTPPAPAPPTSTTTTPAATPVAPVTEAPTSAIETSSPTSSTTAEPTSRDPTSSSSSTSDPTMATTSPWTPLRNTSTPRNGTSSLVSNSDTSTNNSNSNSNTDGISVGLIAGIVVAALVLCGLVALFVFRSRKRRHQQQPPVLVTPGDCLEHAVYGIANAKYVGDQTSATTMTAATGGSRGGDTNTNTNTKTHGQDFAVVAGPGAIGLWKDQAIQAARVPLEAVACGDVLSRGAFGEVLRGSFNGQQVAIKRLLPERRKNMAEIEAFLEEAKLMTTLHHPRIVSLIGVAWDSLSDLCIVAEFMDGGDLRSLLSQYDSANHPTGFNADKLKIAMHVAHALSYLHGLQPSVVHRDLKSKNVLLTSGLDAKLTDFGVSRERGDATMTAGVGSSLWMAPEVMIGDRYDSKADVFSFGVLLSELDTQLLPYAHATEPGTDRKLPEMAILQMVAMGRISVAFSGNADAEIVEMARACVALEPAERPTANEVLHRLHHRWREFGGFV